MTPRCSPSTVARCCSCTSPTTTPVSRRSARRCPARRPRRHAHEPHPGDAGQQPTARPSRQAAPPHRRTVRPGALRCHRRPRPQEADAGDLRPGQPRAAPAGLLARRVRPARLGRPGLRQDRLRRGAAVRAHAVPRERLAQPGRGIPFRAGHVRRRRRPSTCSPRRSASSRSERGTGGNHAFYLSIPPSAFSRRLRAARALRAEPSPSADAWRRVVIEKPFGHDLQSRPASSTPSSRGCSRRTRSSGSTTTSARRRSRTCWRCASPTRCSSRSGTPTTSTTCRSPWPRTSASVAGPATTTASAPPATSSRTTCCSCSR